jgi:hypothetical protein
MGDERDTDRSILCLLYICRTGVDRIMHEIDDETDSTRTKELMALSIYIFLSRKKSTQ